jgi:hypothetical protein
MRELKLEVEQLEERIAPDLFGIPGNDNLSLSDTSNPDLEGAGSVAAREQPGPNP